MKKNKKVAVAIVNWNSKNYLKNCLDSLIKYNINFINKIIVVDNNSSDNSMNIIPNHKLIKIIKQKKNLGFAKGCNIAAKYSKEKYILFLNPDTRLYKNSIKKSLEFMENPINSKTAIMGAKMLCNQKISLSCSYFPTFSRFFFKSVGLDMIFKKRGLLMRDFHHKRSKYVDQVIGAFFLMRKKVFLKLKGFDERFFLYFEEVDLSLRAYNLGYNTFYNADVSCFHQGGVSTSNNKISRDLNYHKHKILYVKKHFSFFHVIGIVAITFTLELAARFLKHIIMFSYNDLKILFKTYYYLLEWVLFKKNKSKKINIAST
jgi:GT2 family glycosyltransferase